MILKIVEAYFMYGNLIKHMRTESGLSQSELAKIVGIAQNSLSAFELNVREAKFELVVRIAEACDFEVILKDTNSNEEIVVKKK